MSPIAWVVLTIAVLAALAVLVVDVRRRRRRGGTLAAYTASKRSGTEQPGTAKEGSA